MDFSCYIKSLPPRILVIGDKSVGKSCLIQTYLAGQFTDGVSTEFASKEIELSEEVVISSEEYSSICKDYYRWVHGVVVTYDTTDSSSFESVDRWISDLCAYSSQHVVVVLCACKADLLDERQVSAETGCKKAECNGIPFFETSAKDNCNISEIFGYLIEEIRLKVEDGKLPHTMKIKQCNIKADKCERDRCAIL